MPPPMTTTSRTLASRGAMDILGEHLDMLDGCGRKDPVPEVEDVSCFAADAREDVVGLAEHPFGGSEQHGRIQISLHRTVAANPLPCVVERNAPVDTDDI